MLNTALHCLLSPTLLRSTILPSSRKQSIHRFLGRPPFLVPISLRSADHLTNSSSSFPYTCAYHLSLLSLNFSLNSATFTSCLFSSFLIFSRLVTPPANRLQTSHLHYFQLLHMLFLHRPSVPYRTTGLTIVLYTCAFSLIAIRVS